MAELLYRRLDTKHGGRTKKQVVVDNLIALAIEKDLRAVRILFEVLLRTYEFDKRNEIEERIEALEKTMEGQCQKG